MLEIFLAEPFKVTRLKKEQIIAKGYDKKRVERVWWWIDKGEFKDRVPYTSK